MSEESRDAAQLMADELRRRPELADTVDVTATAEAWSSSGFSLFEFRNWCASGIFPAEVPYVANLERINDTNWISPTKSVTYDWIRVRGRSVDPDGDETVFGGNTFTTVFSVESSEDEQPYIAVLEQGGWELCGPSPCGGWIVAPAVRNDPAPPAVKATGSG
ncbi:MAG: hypothetical protein O3B27_02980 [Actinomycetota bacterium]|nr:hypothetical protein [Actinomycetota bacterium]MDA2950964.1 hypothetical protein [Actinomycetota bacterium]MDA2990513.1 hypothetical protein [Actinomycetota bacterium]